MPEFTVADAARLLSSLGAKKGGDARAEALSEARMREIACLGVRARWGEKAYQGALKRLKTEKPLGLAKSAQNRQAKGKPKESKKIV